MRKPIEQGISSITLFLMLNLPLGFGSSSQGDDSKQKPLTYSQFLYTKARYLKATLDDEKQVWFGTPKNRYMQLPPLFEWSCTYPTIFGFNITHTPQYVLYNDIKIPDGRKRTFKRQGNFYFRPHLELKVCIPEEEFYHRLKKAGILKPQEDKTTLPKTLRRRIPEDYRE